jgi:hypothetical protein
MVSKCANPGCSTPFLYLHEGKLFRFEHDEETVGGPSFGAELGSRKPARRIEFFWLCDRCAGRMTVVFERGVGIKVRRLGRGQTAA